MRKHRWHVLALVLTLALAGVAAGCGGDGGGGDGEAVSGEISVLAIWAGAEQESFQTVIDGFTEANPDATVKYTSGGDNVPTLLATAIEGGNPPDVAFIAQPGLLADLAEKGSVKPIDFASDLVVENLGQSIADVGSVDGTLYGLLYKAANKSTVWYNVAAFEEAGVEPSEDWDAFLESAKTINASGTPAFSIGASDGWTLTDLFENIYIRQAGVEKYDMLATHEIPWTDQSVKDALTEMAKVVGDTENIVGGTAGALQTDFPTSVSNVFSESPKGAMVIEGDFVPGAVESGLEAEEGYNVFTFPALNDSPPTVVGAGDFAIMLEDSPVAQAFVEYLASAEAAELWAERGGFSSPNKQLDTSVYPDAILQQTAGAIGEAEVFRFDLSDVQPSAFGGTVGQGLFKLFQDFVQKPDDVDGITQQMEDAAAKAFG